MAPSQLAHYCGALTLVDNLRNSTQSRRKKWVSNCPYQLCTYCLPCFGAR